MALLLLIDDHTEILENSAEILKLEGYEVITAKNGKEGLKMAFDFVPDLIICDILMPEMDAFALLGGLGKEPRLKKIPFLFFSAMTEKVDIKKGLGAGANAYLTKPFELKELLRYIEKCLVTKKLS